MAAISDCTYGSLSGWSASFACVLNTVNENAITIDAAPNIQTGLARVGSKRCSNGTIAANAKSSVSELGRNK